MVSSVKVLDKSVGLWGSYRLQHGNTLQILQISNQVIVGNNGENYWNCLWSKQWCGTFESQNKIQRQSIKRVLKIWFEYNPGKNLKETWKYESITEKQKETRKVITR